MGPCLFKWQPCRRVCESLDSREKPGVERLTDGVARHLCVPGLCSSGDYLKLLTHLGNLIRTENAAPLHAGIDKAIGAQ